MGLLLVKIQAHRKPNEVDTSFKISGVDSSWYFTMNTQVKKLMNMMEGAKATPDAALGAVTL